MKRVFLGFLVVAALTLVCGSAALAVPVGPAGEGFSVFAEYDTDWYESAILGAGYGLSENLTVGAYYATEFQDIGLYANLALGPVRLNGEVFFFDLYTCGIVSALYAFDLDPVTLGVGGGFDFYESWDGSFFVTATAELKLDALTVYGGAMYYPDLDWSSFKIGASFTF